MVARVVALPDADQLPETIAGLAPGLPAERQYARRLAEQGCQVLVPTLARSGAAPGKLVPLKLEDVRSEIAQAQRHAASHAPAIQLYHGTMTRRSNRWQRAR